MLRSHFQVFALVLICPVTNNPIQLTTFDWRVSPQDAGENLQHLRLLYLGREIGVTRNEHDSRWVANGWTYYIAEEA